MSRHHQFSYQRRRIFCYSQDSNDNEPESFLFGKSPVDSRASKLINCMHLGLFQLSADRKPISLLTRSPQGKRHKVRNIGLILSGKFNVQKCCSRDVEKDLFSPG